MVLTFEGQHADVVLDPRPAAPAGMLSDSGDVSDLLGVLVLPDVVLPHPGTVRTGTAFHVLRRWETRRIQTSAQMGFLDFDLCSFDCVLNTTKVRKQMEHPLVESYVTAVRRGEDVTLRHDHRAAESPVGAVPPQPLQRHLVRDAVGLHLRPTHYLAVPPNISALPVNIKDVTFVVI